MAVADGWRKTNVTWRPSMLDLLPSVPFSGDDLGAGERAKLGLGAKRAAFRQEAPVHRTLREAGVEAGDVVIGFDGSTIDGTFGDLLGHVRRNYLVGDTLTVNVLRGGRRVDLKLLPPGPVDLALRLRYEGAGYEASDSPALAGMDERKGGLWAGAALRWRGAPGERRRGFVRARCDRARRTRARCPSPRSRTSSTSRPARAPAARSSRGRGGSSDPPPRGPPSAASPPARWRAP